jgi:hypothetical protein
MQYKNLEVVQPKIIIKNWIVYITHNIINGKIYIGYHKISNNKFDDGYLGSGKLFKRAIKKYGKEKFIRRTLEICTEENVGEREEYWIDKLKSRDPLIGYNISKGGFGGNVAPWTNKRKEKISNMHQGKILYININTKEIIFIIKNKKIPKNFIMAKGILKKIYNKDTKEEKMIFDGDNIPNGFILGCLPFSEEHKNNISITKKEQLKNPLAREKISKGKLGKSTSLKGRHFTSEELLYMKYKERGEKSRKTQTGRTYEEIYGEEHAKKIKEKLSMIHKGKPKSEEANKKNSITNKNKLFIYNKELNIEKRINKDENIPVGWLIGRKKYKKRKDNNKI